MSETLVVRLPVIMGFEKINNCTLKMANIDTPIVYPFDKIDYLTTGLEHDNYFTDYRSCSIRVYPEIIQKIEKEKSVKILETDWEIVTYTTEEPSEFGVVHETVEKVFTFFMPGMAWLKENGGYRIKPKDGIYLIPQLPKHY